MVKINALHLRSIISKMASTIVVNLVSDILMDAYRMNWSTRFVLSRLSYGKEGVWRAKLSYFANSPLI